MALPRFSALRSVWPRRLIALTCLLLAGWSALRANPPSARADATVEVVTAARDLPAGAVVVVDDVRLSAWPISIRPATAVTGTKIVVGRTLAGPVGSGEVITSGRLVSDDISAGLPAGLVAVAVPLVDSGTAGLIHPGNRVNLLSPPTDPTRPATVVAANALVLTVVPRDPSLAGSSAQLVVAVDHATELRVAAAITTPMLATLIKPP